MEIIHLVLGKANPERMNGVNKVVFQLASNQSRAKKKVAVWGVTKHLSHNYGERNFTTVLFKSHKNPFFIDSNLKEAIKAKKGKAVFHLHGGWIPIFASLSRYFSKHEIPFVLTPHGAYNTIAMQRSRWLKTVYFFLFEKPLLKRTHKIHSIGESEVDGLQKMYPNEKSFLLPYGFDAPKCGSIPEKENTHFIIGFVGRLDIYTKGLDLLIDSFELFLQSVPNSKLWIVGDSKEMPLLRQKVIEKDIQKKVVLWGAKYGEEKMDLMKKMDIFTHPSRNEGLPSAVLEACNLGIPCVVSKATNVGSYIKKMNAGIEVKNEDALEITKAFNSLYLMKKRNELVQLSLNAKKMVQDIFNWNTITKQFDNLYLK